MKLNQNAHLYLFLFKMLTTFLTYQSNYCWAIFSVVLSAFAPSSSFCCSNNFNNLSVADSSTSTGVEYFGFGNVAVVNSGCWCVNGVHTPWIDGHSVCQCFRIRTALEFLLCVRIKSIHFVSCSSVKLRTHSQCLSPFKYSPTRTGWRWRRGFT